MLLFLLSALANFEIARTTYQNADNVQSYNELSAVFSGNWRLREWSLASDNYYFTDLPFYIICRLIFGYRPALIFVVPFILFMSFLLACALMVRRTGKTERQRDFGCLAILCVLGFPFTPLHDIFLQSTNHAATMAISCWGFLCGQRILARPEISIFRLVPFCMAVFAVTASDPQAIFYFVGPLSIVVSVRWWLYGRLERQELLLAGFALLAGGLGMELVGDISQQGGFSIAANYSLNFVPSVTDVVKNGHTVLQALLIAFDANPTMIAVPHAVALIACSRGVIFIVSSLLCLRVLWRMPREPDRGFAQWLMFGVLVLGAADVMSCTFATVAAAGPSGSPVFAVRFVTPIYVFMVIAAVIEGQDVAMRMAARSAWCALRGAGLAAGVLFAIYCAGIIQATARDASQFDYQKKSPQYKLAVWLRAHHLNYGVGDYWTAQTVTAWGYGAVTEDPVTPVDGRLTAYRFVGDMSRLDADQSPQFVAFMPVNQYDITLKNVITTYGQPKAVIKLDGVVLAILR